MTRNAAQLLQSATTVTIYGDDFDGSDPSGNGVGFNLGVAGYVVNSTDTSLTVSLTSQPATQPSSVGQPLEATVTSFGLNSGAPVQVATIVEAPTVVANAAFNLAANAPSLAIAGTNFDMSNSPTTPVQVALSSGGVASVAVSSTRLLTVYFSSPPSLGMFSDFVVLFFVFFFGGGAGTREEQKGARFHHFFLSLKKINSLTLLSLANSIDHYQVLSPPS